MGFRDWFKSKNNNERGTTLTSNNIFSIFGVNTEGVSVTTQTAMQHTTVYACVNVKAQGLSSVPFEFYKKTKNGREKAENHPLYKIISRQVNPLMTSSTWREMVVQDIELRGTHFSQIQRDRAGRIIALYPLLHDNMTVEIMINEDNTPSLKYIYTPSLEDSTNKTVFTDKDILRIVGLPSSNGILGITPITQNKQSIGLGMQTEQFGSKFFENGANGSGILSTESTFKDGESIERLRKQFGDKYTGLANSKKPIVLENGMKWQPITISNNDSQFLETRQFQKSEIASIFRVSPHLINDLKNATFSNITELSLEHVKYCLMPLAVRIESAIWSQLLSDTEQKKYYAEFNFNGLTRGDIKTRFEAYQIGINTAVLTPNEARQWENLDTDSEIGNKQVINNSYATLEEVEKKELSNEQATNQEIQQEEFSENETE